MRKDIHPKYQYVIVTCANCGAKFKIGTTLASDFQTPVCSKCHPAYTGKELELRKVDRVAKFMAKLEKAKQLKAGQKNKKG